MLLKFTGVEYALPFFSQGDVEERLRKGVARVTQELEDLRWEHKMESFISLEIFNDMAFECSEEMNRLSAKLHKEVS